MSTTIAIAFCALLGPMDHSFCQPPPIEEACWSVTNYWVFDENLQHVAFGGQADSDPYHTALMVPVTPELEWRMAAGPKSLLGREFVFPDGVAIPILDTFGATAYQSGVFWHHTYSEWVIGVDMFTKEPLHYLECRGEIN